MTYEKKYRIARAGLDHLERAFVEMSSATQELLDAYHFEAKVLKSIIEKQEINEKRLSDQNKEFEYRYEIAKEKMIRFEELYEAERDKSWWQKLKETIKTKIR